MQALCILFILKLMKEFSKASQPLIPFIIAIQGIGIFLSFIYADIGDTAKGRRSVNANHFDGGQGDNLAKGNHLGDS